MTYLQTQQYLESFINYEKIPAYPYKESLKLERINGFLAEIGNPERFLNCVHIAGTKGKGSTCAFIAFILRQAGYKVGLYTSPHLSDFRERIRILSHQVQEGYPGDFEGMIRQDELRELVERLKPAIESYNKNSQYGPLSFFEVYTCLAFVYFKEKKVDFVVLETGLGGRLDATNAVEALVSVITPLSFEHTEKLGNTLREIAAEKAGIIKAHSAQRTAHNSIIISAPQEEEARQVIRQRCKERGAKLYELGRDIAYQKVGKGFNVKGIFGEYPDLKIKLLGEHQLINATLAIGVIEALRLHNINVNTNSIREGLYNTLWPGRCEVISTDPLIVLDGCQNVASAKALKSTIKDNLQYKKLILVLGISQDKDIKGICTELDALADEVILTKADNPRACSPEALQSHFNGKITYITNSVREAKVKAVTLVKKSDLILVCGSLFVVGEFRDLN